MQEENKNQKSQRAQAEEKVLEFWQENKIFEKSLSKDSPLGEYVFFEGPPTANGKPGIHHLEARAFKDVIPRYKTMCGYHVRRKGGWDTHGLPVELQVEKKLGLNSKKAIEEYGIAKFNQECKESVWEYLEYWNKFTERIGFWVDQKNPYVTYKNDYIESVWNVIKEADKKKLLYKDYKVVPWCPRCGTGLSSHELAQGYENIKDLSVYVKFKVISSSDAFPQVLGRGGRELVPDHSEKHTEELPVYILAWTTTPWTLPGNVALAIGKDIDYVKIKLENEFFILAKERLHIIDVKYEIVKELKGKDLIGLEYEPLYPFLQNTISNSEKPKLEKAFKIYPADFVTTEDGTGVVHTAVMYGQDDFVLGNEIGLPKHHLVGLDGKFFTGTDFLEGRFVRDEDVAVDIIKDLAHRGLLLKKEKYEHSYPHCWRCKTALVYYARDSWYIKMTELRDKMVEENKNINWEPSYIKEGRFGEWLSDIKDWAISRERYWGTPLPVWTCDKCNKIEVLGSLDEIKSKTKKSGNKYFVMRHGEGEHQIKGIHTLPLDQTFHLTENGKDQVKESISELKTKNITKIISSPVLRCKETAEIVSKALGISFEINEQIHELDSGEFDGKDYRLFDEWLNNTNNYFKDKPVGGESLLDAKKRFGKFLLNLENNLNNENILIISHGISLEALSEVAEFADEERSKYIAKNLQPQNAIIKELEFVNLPHNEDFELDLHKPYIDEVELVCAHSDGSGQVCGGKLERTKEVMDVWLDSGTMPFSQDHYPFEPEGKGTSDGSGNKEQEILYPADFISEAIDQTRGWFYTLHAVGAIMGKGKAYKNVICLGHILDANGKKMSKSLGNIVDPWIMMDKYGVDTLRMWMYSVNQPGESKNFDEKTVSELNNKVFNLLYNVLAFYELYRDKTIEDNSYERSNNILDQWILALFGELNMVVTNNLDNYKLLEPVRAIRDFIDDLSTWYLRRSRDRIKNGDKEAKQTLYFMLKNLSKMMAPFAPFSSEDIWQKLKIENDVESVHLVDWIDLSNFADKHMIDNMQKVREIVTIGLQLRQKNNIPVRQPLSDFTINKQDLNSDYLEIIKDELNVKDIKFGLDIVMNLNITPELKQEGNYRELIRAIQEMRKIAKLNPNDLVDILIDTDDKGKELIDKFQSDFERIIGARSLTYKNTEGNEIKIDDMLFKVNILK